MLSDDASYAEKVANYFANTEYDPVAVCTNHLFHTHTASLQVSFRQATPETLRWLIAHPHIEPLVLTNSLGAKVEHNLGRLELPPVRILGDTRQYDLDVSWTPPFGGGALFLTVDDLHTADLRRRIYYDALIRELNDGSRLVVIADTLSLPGVLPLTMGIPFGLLRTGYSPGWCIDFVDRHPMGMVLDDLTALPAWVARLLVA